MDLRRWFARRFLTRIREAPYNRHGSRILTVDEWEAQGGRAGALVPGWYVERPDWWCWGSSLSGVTAETIEEARGRLDAWQDKQAQR